METQESGIVIVNDWTAASHGMILGGILFKIYHNDQLWIYLNHTISEEYKLLVRMNDRFLNLISIIEKDEAGGAGSEAGGSGAQ